MPGLTLLLQEVRDPCRRTYGVDLAATYAAIAGVSYPVGSVSYVADTATSYPPVAGASYAAATTASYSAVSGATYPTGTVSYPAGSASYGSGTATYTTDGDLTYGGCGGS